MYRSDALDTAAARLAPVAGVNGLKALATTMIRIDVTPGGFPRVDSISIDATVLAFTLLVCVSPFLVHSCDQPLLTATGRQDPMHRARRTEVLTCRNELDHLRVNRHPPLSAHDVVVDAVLSAFTRIGRRFDLISDAMFGRHLRPTRQHHQLLGG